MRKIMTKQSKDYKRMNRIQVFKELDVLALIISGNKIIL